MRKGGVLTYMLTDHLGSTSLMTNTSGVVLSETRYSAWGEVRYQAGTMSTGYTYTGQYSDSYINLLDYGSRRYDPELGRFIQPDSIVPLASQGVQAWDRYGYANNNPVRYTDPSGHSVCGLSGSGVCTNDEELVAFADKTVLDYGGKNDLEGVARIVEKAARLYKTYDEMIPALSMVFLGVQESNPTTWYRAALANPCAAVGRGCENEVFVDKGFHPDFQDTKGQPFHYWAYVTTSASTDVPADFSAFGILTGNLANIAHENFGIGDLAGATWEDYALAQAGINTGEMIAIGAIPPNELGNYIRENIGTNSSGAPYVNFMVSFWPLYGNRR